MHAVHVTHSQNCGLQKWRLMHTYVNAVDAVAHALNVHVCQCQSCFHAATSCKTFMLMCTEAQYCLSMEREYEDVDVPLCRSALGCSHANALVHVQESYMCACDMTSCHSPGSA